MRRTGIATIFDLGDMIGSANCQVATARTGKLQYFRAVPIPFYDGLLARLRAAWEIVCGRAYPCRWPEAGDLEKALGP
jgi:hypothetical protein